MPTNIALIVAAGRGYRLGGPLPKQYLALQGQPILRRTLQAFLNHPQIHAVQVLIHPDDIALFAAATANLHLPPPLFGGATRQETVRNGLEGIAHLNPDNVLIHDAVRPFIAPEIISAILAALTQFPAALTAIPVADTLKRVQNNFVTATIDRAEIFRAQTPQAFRFAEIISAHRQLAATTQEFTDDSMIAEHFSIPVQIIPGSEENFKITTQQDLARAEAYLGRKQASTSF